MTDIHERAAEIRREDCTNCNGHGYVNCLPREGGEPYPCLCGNCLEARQPALSAAPAPSDADLIELRPRENGEFDELFARFANGTVHIETLSGTSCFVGFDWDDGRRCQWYVNSTRKLTYYYEITGGAILTPPAALSGVRDE